MADIDEPMEVDSQTTEVKAGKAKAGKDASGKKRFEVKKVNQQTTPPQFTCRLASLLLLLWLPQDFQELDVLRVLWAGSFSSSRAVQQGVGSFW